jgi:hypothetical protein
VITTTPTPLIPAITTLKNTEIKSRKSPINGIQKIPDVEGQEIKNNDVEIIPILTIKKSKKTIQMLFKKNDYKYCVENLYGNTKILPINSTIHWEKTFSPEDYKNFCGKGLTDSLWGI